MSTIIHIGNTNDTCVRNTITKKKNTVGMYLVFAYASIH